MNANIFKYATRLWLVFIKLFTTIVLAIQPAHFSYAQLNKSNGKKQKEFITITDYKNFKIIDHKNARLFVMSNGSYIIYSGKHMKSQVFIKKQETQYSNEIKTANLEHYIHYSKNKSNRSISYNLQPRLTYFMTGEDFCILPLEQKITHLETDFLEKLAFSSHISRDLVDNNSCSSLTSSRELANKIDKNIQDTVTCLTDPNKKSLITDSALSGIFNNMSSNVFSIADDKYNEKISFTCDGEKQHPDKLGFFDSKSPNKISLNYKKINAEAAKKNISADLIATDIIKHELNHFALAGNQNKNFMSLCEYYKEFNKGKIHKLCVDYEEHKKKNSGSAHGYQSNLEAAQIQCLQEAQNSAMVRFCDPSNDDSNFAINQLFEDLEKDTNCFSPLEKSSLSTNKPKDKIDGLNNSGVMNMSNSTAEQKTEAAHASNNAYLNQQKQTETHLQKTVTESDFTRSSSQEFAKLAEQTRTTQPYERPYQIPADSDYGKNVQKVVSDFQTSEHNLTKKLNTTLKSVLPAAEASNSKTIQTYSHNSTSPLNTTGVSTVSSASINNLENSKALLVADSRTPASNNAQPINAQVDYSAERNLANAQASDTIAKTTVSPNPNNLNSKTNNELATASTNEQNPNLSGNSAQPANSRQSGSSVNLSFGSSNGSSIASSGSNNAANNRPVRSPAALPTSSNVGQSIQTLRAMSSLTGNSYENIKSLYRNAEFNEKLKQYKIRIITKNSNGQFVALGQTKGEILKTFKDDGSSLKITTVKIK